MVPLFQIFDKTVSIYMILGVIGVLVVMFAMYRLAVRDKLDEIEMLWMVLVSFIGVFLGGSLLYGLVNYRMILALIRNWEQVDSFGTFLDCILSIFGGSVFYGGLLGMLLAIWIYRKKRRLSHRYFDAAAVGIPLFHTFGRLGCFLGGCCYGVECKFGFTYHYSLAPDANGVSRFPVQLLEALFNACLALILYRLFRRKKLEGRLINVYLYAYPAFRFLDEFLRGDTYRGLWWGLSTSQWISLLIILGNTVYLLLSHKKTDKKTDAG
ncbi:MAG: prolipoprotein diacylglyceryl transferase [Oscillospiraceae bacterium]|nr:prolipoprotein diacylglyceryl transferase [Oscillospiraceae bacterium]